MRLIIFDCDGVLVDSEPIANRVTAQALTRLGWPITAAECERRFLGMSLADMCRAIEAERGVTLPEDWESGLAGQLAAALGREAVAIPGAEAALHAVARFGLDWRIASNSGLAELAAKFACIGLSELVAGRVLSAETIIARGGRGKPAPDLFLEAARGAGVAPAACLVVEDSLAGVRGARAAGMGCLGYAPRGDGAALRAAGARPFHDLAHLPALLRAAMQGPVRLP
ncbi:MAG: HAD-IA family hydrolase [Rhodospirillales bacterium]|nr:HAD-IA family hydrolase [Rhodospirillales bacterium]